MAAAVLERSPGEHRSVSHAGISFEQTGSLLTNRVNGRIRKSVLSSTSDLVDTLLTRSLDRLNIHFPPSPIPGLHPRNATIAGLMQPDYRVRPDALHTIAEVLEEKKATKLAVVNGRFVDVVGSIKPQKVALVKATEVEGTAGDMVEKVWIRDQTQAAQAFFETWKLDKEKYKAEGEMAKVLIESAMSLMATQGQLDRFKEVIADPDKGNRDKKLIRDQNKAPQIAIKMEDDDYLNTRKRTDWRHLQDAWQMLGVVALDALKEELIKPEELAKGHRQFLTSMVPYLAAVDFPHTETSGTWEENPATRLSVTAVETALLHRVQTYMHEPEFTFLRDGYEDAQASGHLPMFHDARFETAVETMIDQGLRQIASWFPNESPDYRSDIYWVQHRGVDITLLYLLDYGIPQLLADREIPVHGEPRTRKWIEQRILDKIDATLYDKELHGYKRYIGDSYQALNFWTREKQQAVNDLKDTMQEEARREKRPIDLHEKQIRRYELFKKELEQGHEAIWFHPNSQVVNWAARSFRETGDKWYAEQAQKYYNRLLATLTGEDEYHVVLNGSNKKEIQHDIKKVPAFRWAESATKRRTLDGRVITTIGPFVPFNWGTALAGEATANMLDIITRDYTKGPSESHMARDAVVFQLN